MKYLNEYSNLKIARGLAQKIAETVRKYPGKITLMEVCGTHTVAIFRSGIRQILPEKICLLSGPGCPVCVTPNDYLDKAIACTRRKDLIVVTFGDMLRVPGSSSSLEKERSRGGRIEVVYSAMDALEIARSNPDKKVIFLGVGFETTAPTLAATILTARERKINNFFVFSGHKLIPPAMKALVESKELHIDGFICPGHVSTIIGVKPYEFIARDHNLPCVIAGFEPLDILQAIYMLVQQIVNRKKAEVEIQYTRVVKPEGNPKALDLIREVFEVTESMWRGMGNIPESGLKIREKYSGFDAEPSIRIKAECSRENKKCICGEILRGVKIPTDCPLFRTACTPQNPIGPCMVSSEGTCAAHYKYAGS